jgi:hypothetical protein
MSLWDEQAGSIGPLVERLTPDRRFAVAVAAIDQTVASFEPPLGDGQGARLVREGLARARAAVGHRHTGLPLPDDLEEHMAEAIADDPERGVGQLLMAVGNCYGIPEPGMTAEFLESVLYDCYEAVLARAPVEGDDPDEERADPRCTAAVARLTRLVETPPNL